eukprot:jgi/Mesvir1/2787/Mv13722-RA.1
MGSTATGREPTTGDFRDKGLARIPPLPQLPHLRSLDLSNNNVFRLDGLQQARALEELRVSCNRIARLELRQLSGLRSLRILVARNNCIGRMQGLDMCPALEVVDLSCNNVTSIEGLDRCRSLVHLNLSHNHISALEGLAACESLLHLDVSHNIITTLASAPTALPTRLQALDLSHNEIEDPSQLKYLTPCTDLVELSVAHNPMAAPNVEFDIRPLVLFLLPRLLRVDNEAAAGTPWAARSHHLFSDAFGVLDESQLLLLEDGQGGPLLAYLRAMCPVAPAHRQSQPSPGSKGSGREAGPSGQVGSSGQAPVAENPTNDRGGKGREGRRSQRSSMSAESSVAWGEASRGGPRGEPYAADRNNNNNNNSNNNNNNNNNNDNNNRSARTRGGAGSWSDGTDGDGDGDEAVGRLGSSNGAGDRSTGWYSAGNSHHRPQTSTTATVPTTATRAGRQSHREGHHPQHPGNHSSGSPKASYAEQHRRRQSSAALGPPRGNLQYARLPGQPRRWEDDDLDNDQGWVGGRDMGVWGNTDAFSLGRGEHGAGDGRRAADGKTAAGVSGASQSWPGPGREGRAGRTSLSRWEGRASGNGWLEERAATGNDGASDAETYLRGPAGSMSGSTGADWRGQGSPRTRQSAPDGPWDRDGGYEGWSERGLRRQVEVLQQQVAGLQGVLLRVVRHVGMDEREPVLADALRSVGKDSCQGPAKASVNRRGSTWAGHPLPWLPSLEWVADGMSSSNIRGGRVHQSTGHGIVGADQGGPPGQDALSMTLPRVHRQGRQGGDARRRPREPPSREERAAIVIQKWVRGHSVRRRFTLFEAYRRAAVAIQRRWRGVSTRTRLAVRGHPIRLPGGSAGDPLGASQGSTYLRGGALHPAISPATAVVAGVAVTGAGGRHKPTSAVAVRVVGDMHGVTHGQSSSEQGGGHGLGVAVKAWEGGGAGASVAAITALMTTVDELQRKADHAAQEKEVMEEVLRTVWAEVTALRAWKESSSVVQQLEFA